jgi:A/G-specific adenine glycosylase
MDATPTDLPGPTEPEILHARLLEWYDATARDLPWRRPEATPWGVLVSEVMLQQTPVARVLPVWESWLTTWPRPADLADAGAGEAVRAWGRLGYPRRALRLHATALAIVERHGGEVPSDHRELLDLPGIGEYTAAAVASFAFGQRHAVLDTNVRRVLARLVLGREHPGASLTRAERELAVSLLPEVPSHAPAWGVAVMELGALVCTAARPRCEVCPVAELCRWRAAGRPPDDGPARRGQSWAGTDRQVRGRLMAVLRGEDGPVHRSRLEAVWHDERQRTRCLETLVADGLAVRLDGETFALPT